jgi:hypothetical protein
VPGGIRLTAVMLNVAGQATNLRRGERITLCWSRSAEHQVDAGDSAEDH